MRSSRCSHTLPGNHEAGWTRVDREAVPIPAGCPLAICQTPDLRSKKERLRALVMDFLNCTRKFDWAMYEEV